MSNLFYTKRLHHLGAARAAELIASGAFLHIAPTLQESEQRRVSAAEAALKAAGVPEDQVAVHPSVERPRPRGRLHRLASWLLESDDDNDSRLDALRRTRKDAVGHLRKVEHRILKAHTRQRHADVASVPLAHSERALASELWAAYQDGVRAGLPAGAADLGGPLDCGAPPDVELPTWATAGSPA